MEDKYGTITISYVKRDYFEETNPNGYEYRATSTTHRVVGSGETPSDSLKDFISKIDDREDKLFKEPAPVKGGY